VLGFAGVRFIQDEVFSITREERRIGCRSTTLTYDYLVLSAGAENNFFNIPGAEEFSFRFRTAQDAERIRMEVVRLFDDPAAVCRIVLAGGGTEGVEAAGELLDLAATQGRDDDLKSGRISIDLIEGKKRLLTGFGKVQDRGELPERTGGTSTGVPLLIRKTVAV
jgi:NADH dehydrogenase FAD-containing subunit